jgi:hypothetical protein
MLTSIKITAMSVFRRCSNASLADVAVMRFFSQVREDGFIAQQFAWLIVDHQDVDRLTCIHDLLIAPGACG